MKNGNPRLALWLGESAAEYFLANYAEVERFKEGGETLLLIPVPLTQSKKKKRGYNQAEELAKSIGKRLKEHGVQVELRNDVLERLRDSEEQKHMGFEDRHSTAEAIYHVHKRKECRDRTVLLIDDIMTTGATGSACAARLYGANAKEVLFLTPTALPEQK
jgi:predicted amidophosphoribosyltransferase